MYKNVTKGRVENIHRVQASLVFGKIGCVILSNTDFPFIVIKLTINLIAMVNASANEECDIFPYASIIYCFSAAFKAWLG